MKIYDTVEAMKFIKNKYKFIPIWIIRRVMYANDLYQNKIGIMDATADLSWWTYPRRFKKSK